METAQVLRMKAGHGEESYAQNSKYQTAYISETMPVLQLALLDFCSTGHLPNCVTVADLGCSSGPNTWMPISEILSTIHRRYREEGRLSPEFQVFLNDLPSNDFNDVFKSVSEFLKKMRDENGADFGPCYVTGVPGSFYGRLFPEKSLQFVHAASSLHWLSQVPPELSVRSSKRLVNKGKIYISKTSPPEVADAYLNQFRRDFSAFLKSRSEEIVPRGWIVAQLRGRRTPDPSHEESCLLWDYLGKALQDLVSEGLIEEEKLDSYNAPYYEPYIEDVQAEIEKEGSFILHRLEIISIPWDGVNGGQKYDRAKTAEKMAKAIRAVNESMLQNHFGGQVMDRFFQRFSEIVAADTKEVEHVSLVVSLIRKS
ncbi:jasmonate O-methyltransferase-like [Punica granatum]|uniref:Uncharacterized protein n=2 Tax=Punica granatum TaxID=22663 RepID=A0A218W1D8_PUNGR|nr:jasmonate O-methyltransferase-like [Punica granatum]OWM66456.1 hypothetical protein CDL15_Pgr013673 [Punica granatum]PKI59895.1 hypothetical protein CRG98_019668 [Punica granatum]